MGRVQINSGDGCGIVDEIRQGIAAAARDRQDPAALIDFQRLHIDDRIFPYLGIDQALERMGERLVEQLRLCFCFTANYGAGDEPIRRY